MTPLLLFLSFLAIGLAGWCLNARISMAQLKQIIDRERQDATAHQQQLTREVHHRVKNNLQIVASLLSIHSRAANTPAAQRAFTTIQRRVDALTIVHRNMASGQETAIGLPLRTLMSELASVFDGDAAAHGRAPIALSCGHGTVPEDRALPVAFVVTEIIDLIVDHDPAGAIRLNADNDDASSVHIVIGADSLRDASVAERLSSGREGRILAGLGRQLGSSISHDAGAGKVRFSVALVGD